MNNDVIEKYLVKWNLTEEKSLRNFFRTQGER